ncbi:MAG TPA: ankyrin repeat domain-containing protein [Gaiellaceae bacterium]|nr:ankyrin repeat domain-containing protein [Gaiellaceae bacterium]
MNLEQLRKQAKDLARAAREGDEGALARLGDLPVRLASAQTVLAREHGFRSWPTLVREFAEQPFRTDLEYYEGRAEGIATVNGVSIASARRDLARRHGFASWNELSARVTALASGEEAPSPFMLAYRAVEDGDRDRLEELLDRHPELVRTRGTNGNDLLGMAGDLESVRLLIERGADVNRGNDYGWTKLHQAGYSNDRPLAELVLAAGARTDLSARGDGGTPLVAALFWGHREVVDLLGVAPRNLRVAAGLGLVELIDELIGKPAAGAHRGFYRPHGGFPAWEPSDDPREILDEALVWAAKAGRVAAIDRLVELGADVESDPYRGTPLAWAAVNGRRDAIRRLVELGADPNGRGTFGGPTHGEGVPPLHLAAQSGQEAAVDLLLELGADPAIRDALYDGTAAGWAAHGCRPDLADRLE